MVTNYVGCFICRLFTGRGCLLHWIQMPAIRIFSNWVFAQWVRLSEHWHQVFGERSAGRAWTWGCSATGPQCYLTKSQLLSLVQDTMKSAQPHGPPALSPPTKGALAHQLCTRFGYKSANSSLQRDGNWRQHQQVNLSPATALYLCYLHANKTPQNWATVQTSHFHMPDMESKK